MVSLGDTQPQKDTVVGLVCTAEGRKRAIEVARAFREAGIRTEMDLMERGLGAQLQHAAKTADFAVVIGQREADSGEVTLKNLKTGEQKTVVLRDAVNEVGARGSC
jgi:histidyl-tRNA synthetase